MMIKHLRSTSSQIIISISLFLTILLSTVAWIVGGSSITNGNRWTVPLRMPDIRPDHDDQYLCMTYRATSATDDDNQQEWVVGFEPRANSSRIHHMMVYACELPGIYQPGEPKFVWDCSGMASMTSKFIRETRSHHQHEAIFKKQLSTFERGPVCQGQEQIIYGWALDANGLNLPDKIGFRIGGSESPYQFLVMQVHYHNGLAGNDGHQHHQHNAMSKSSMRHSDSNKLPVDLPVDNSGILLKMANHGITREAGVLLMSSAGVVEPGSSKHEILCQLDENDAELHPIRFRVHTHKFGTKVLGGRLIRRQFGMGLTSGGFILDLIGERNPQDPEMFYPVQRDDMVIGPGDTIYAACHYNQTNPWPVKIGPTSDDEMCNFYIMYWTDGPLSTNQKACLSVNPGLGYNTL